MACKQKSDNDSNNQLNSGRDISDVLVVRGTTKEKKTEKMLVDECQAARLRLKDANTRYEIAASEFANADPLAKQVYKQEYRLRYLSSTMPDKSVKIHCAKRDARMTARRLYDDVDDTCGFRAALKELDIHYDALSAFRRKFRTFVDCELDTGESWGVDTIDTVVLDRQTAN